MEKNLGAYRQSEFEAWIRSRFPGEEASRLIIMEKMLFLYLQRELRTAHSLFGTFGLPDNLRDVTEEPAFHQFLQECFERKDYEAALKDMERMVQSYEEFLQEDEDSEEIQSSQEHSQFKEITQSAYIHDLPQNRLIIQDGPGSGKTWALTHRLMYLIGPECPNPLKAEQVLVICSSFDKVVDLRSQLRKCAVDQYTYVPHDKIQIHTMYSLSRLIIRELEDSKSGVNRILEAEEDRDDKSQLDTILNAVDTFEAACRRKNNFMSRYSYVAIHDFQDIHGAEGDFLLLLLSKIPRAAGISALGDSAQAVFDMMKNSNSEDDSGKTTSLEFLHEMQQSLGADEVRMKGTHHYNLTINEEIKKLRPNLTNALNVEATRKEIEDLEDSINEVEFNELAGSIRWCLRMGEKSGFKPSVGIIVKNNAQALQLAELLYAEKLPAYLKTDRRNTCFAGWIGFIFGKYDSNTISKYGFIAFFKEVFSDDKAKQLLVPGENNPDGYWDALESCYEGKKKPSYTVEEILLSIQKNAIYHSEYWSFLYAGVSPNQPIVISTARQARGDKYDFTYLHESLFQPETLGLKGKHGLDMDWVYSKTLAEECRISYIALTRAKKGMAQIVECPESPGASHWYENQGTRRLPVKDHILVGYEGDLNWKSFAKNVEIQEFIHDYVPLREPAILEKYNRVWRIAARQPGGVKKYLADMSFDFFLEILKLLDKDYYAVNQLDHLYISDIITWIQNGYVGEGAREYGRCSIWNGLDVWGLAQIVDRG
jgi:hypothetical protein